MSQQFRGVGKRKFTGSSRRGSRARAGSLFGRSKVLSSLIIHGLGRNSLCRAVPFCGHQRIQ